MAFKVEIIDINKNADNMLLTDDLTIEMLKIKYNWILNASVKNCIIGLDSYGIVWYSGEWICGEWEDGTWYSGIWHDGTWKNGKWYSYLLDNAMILSKRFVILAKDKSYSEFRSGNWLQGYFYDGTFGYDRDISNLLIDDINNKQIISGCSYWYNGNFYSGLFKNSVWYNGIFYNGDITNSYWMKGKFYKGTFDNYIWYDGSWYGGDFKRGDWVNGIFDQVDVNIKSRFGTVDKSRWYNGNFSNGTISHQPEFHSGLNLDSSGNTLPSINSSGSTWFDGDFNGGKWYGGYFKNGNFHDGNWYGGIFGSSGTTNTIESIWVNGQWYDGLWINGIFKKGHFHDGMWIDGVFENGYISTNLNENDITSYPTFTTIYPPTVVTYSATTTSSYNVIMGNGRVTNDGGSKIIDRGVCWAISGLTNNPTLSTNSGFASDGATTGAISIKMKPMLYFSSYLYRAYARNITGLTYGDVYSFTTTGSTEILQVATSKETNKTYESVTLNGMIVTIPSPTVDDHGFCYTGHTSPLMTYIETSIGTGNAGPFDETISVTASTLYDYKAYAIDDLITVYGITESFTTPAYSVQTVPIVDTISVTLSENSPQNSAVLIGQIIDNVSAPIIREGACWNTTGNPTISDTCADITSNITEDFTINLTGLSIGVTYYVKAFATNKNGLIEMTGYGVEIPITTASPPIVVMISVNNP